MIVSDSSMIVISQCNTVLKNLPIQIQHGNIEV